MVYRVVYRNDKGIFEAIVVADSDLEAMLIVKKEKPIDEKFIVKEIIEITKNGIVSTETIKLFTGPWR